MCGHVGIAGKLEYKDEATMKRLLLLDYFRGPDSTGLASVLRDGTGVHLAKMASHPLDLFDSKSFSLALSAYKSRAFIGHNRLATKGKINGANAHPYIFGNIVGAHNGTLDAGSWVDLDKLAGVDTDVDSMAVFAAIEKVGVEETIANMRGAWALVWVDTDTGKLYMIRNKERPLWISFSKAFDKVFWASEWPMIQAATEMCSDANGYELYEDKDGCCFFPLDEDVLYEFDTKKMVLSPSAEVLKCKTKTLKGKDPLPKPVVTQQSGTTPFSTTNSTSSTNTPTGTGTGDNTPREIRVSTNDEYPFADFFDPVEYAAMCRAGCSTCKAPIHPTDEGVMYIESVEALLCPECSDSEVNVYQASPKTFREYLDETALRIVN